MFFLFIISGITGELELTKKSYSDMVENKQLLDEKLGDSLVRVEALEQKEEILRNQLEVKITELKERNAEYQILFEKSQSKISFKNTIFFFIKKLLIL
jgi:hypothetical protein